MAERLAEAEAAFRKSHALSPDETVLNFNLARIAARRGRAQEALAKLQPYLDRGLDERRRGRPTSCWPTCSRSSARRRSCSTG